MRGGGKVYARAFGVVCYCLSSLRTPKGTPLWRRTLILVVYSCFSHRACRTHRRPRQQVSPNRKSGDQQDGELVMLLDDPTHSKMLLS